MANEIWVFIERSAHGDVAGVSKELLGKARELADANGMKVGALILGSGVGDIPSVAFSYGADTA